MSAVKYVDINGESMPVRYDVNALCLFEDLTGRSLLKGLKASIGPDGKPQIDLTTKELRAIVFVGLKSGARFDKKEFKHNIEDVGEWLGLNDGTFGKFLDAFNEGLGGAEKPESKGEEKPGE